MYEFIHISNNELNLFDQYVIDSPCNNIRQTSYWGRIKAISGWEPHYFAVTQNGSIQGTAFVQVRKIPHSHFSVMYCCRGPVIDWNNGHACGKMFSGLSDFLRNKGAFCLRFDPEISDTPEQQNTTLLQNKMIKLKTRLSLWNRNLYTTRVMLRKDEGSLFSQMRRTHRQNINKTIRSGVSISYDPSPDDKKNFYQLMCGLENKKNSLIHSMEYYNTIYDTLINNNIGYFIKAHFENKIISGLMVAIIKDKAWALFLANDYQYRDLMPNKLLLWEAIKLANQKGCVFLDLGSTQGTESFDPASDSFDLLKHAYKPDIINFPGYFDMPGKFYNVFHFMENNAAPSIIKYYYKLNRFMKMRHQQ